MKKLVFIFAIMLGVASCNSSSNVETESVDVTDSVVDSIVEVDSLVVDSVQ